MFELSLCSNAYEPNLFKLDTMITTTNPLALPGVVGGGGGGGGGGGLH